MSKAMKISLFGVLAFCAYAQPVFAREFADIYTECGLGALIAPRNEAVAAVTNVTWDLGTTAISSNISSPDTCKGGQARAAAFIHDAYASLESDIASGQGEHLNTLMTLAGKNTAEAQGFIAALRNDFSKAVADASYSSKTRFEKAETLYNLVYKNS